MEITQTASEDQTIYQSKTLWNHFSWTLSGRPKFEIYEWEGDFTKRGHHVLVSAVMIPLFFSEFTAFNLK